MFLNKFFIIMEFQINMTSSIFMLTDSYGSVRLHMGSQKFWEIQLKDKETIIWYGKIENGEPYYNEDQVSTKSHASERQAKEYFNKHIKLKLQKGYEIVDDQLDLETRSVSKASETSEADEHDWDVEEPKPYKKIHLDEEGFKKKIKMNEVSQEDEPSEEFQRDEEPLKENEEEEFKRKVNALDVPKPLGEPIFRGYTSLCTPNLWENEDLEGWYLFEKLGGIRVIWNGLEMWSKRGKRYEIPDSMSIVLPNSPLEGVLCTHMGRLSKCISIVQHPSSKEWEDLRFVVCDAPNLNLPYKERYKKLKEIIPNGPSVFLHHSTVCTGRNHILAELEKIEKSGGEGILLRDPDSLYMKGRVRTVIEVRSSFKGEAIVIKHISGKKKYPGQVGCLKVRSEDGIEFAISRGLTKDMRKNPPKIGSKVIYSYHAKIDETKPRNPLYVKTLSQYSNC